MNRYQVMLARLGDKGLLEKNTIGWIFEPKLDGTRVLIYKEGPDIQLINRRGYDITYRYPELLDVSHNIKAEKAVLDAELVVLDKNGRPNFNLLQQREQLDKPFLIKSRSKSMPATLFVFDILEKNGIPLIDKLLKERRQELAKTIRSSPFIMLCPSTLNGKALWKQIQKQKMEGLIAKDLNSRYEQGRRSWAWLKIKNLNTIDAVIVGFTKGSGTRKSSFGALVLALYNKIGDLVYVGRVGTGFNQKLLTQLTKIMKKLITKQSALNEQEQKKLYGQKHIEVEWIKPELVAEIKYLELTRENELRAPSFMRLRFDKRPEECVVEN